MSKLLPKLIPIPYEPVSSGLVIVVIELQERFTPESVLIEPTTGLIFSNMVLRSDCTGYTGTMIGKIKWDPTKCNVLTKCKYADNTGPSYLPLFPVEDTDQLWCANNNINTVLETTRSASVVRFIQIPYELKNSSRDGLTYVVRLQERFTPQCVFLEPSTGLIFQDISLYKHDALCNMTLIGKINWEDEKYNIFIECETDGERPSYLYVLSVETPDLLWYAENLTMFDSNMIVRKAYVEPASTPVPNSSSSSSPSPSSSPSSSSSSSQESIPVPASITRTSDSFVVVMNNVRNLVYSSIDYAVGARYGSTANQYLNQVHQQLNQVWEWYKEDHPIPQASTTSWKPCSDDPEYLKARGKLTAIIDYHAAMYQTSEFDELVHMELIQDAIKTHLSNLQLYT